MIQGWPVRPRLCPTSASAEHLIVHRDLLREPAVRQMVDALVWLYRDRRAELEGAGSTRAATILTS